MPDHWQSTTLAEVAKIKQGETIAVKTLAGGPHPVYGANGIVGWHHLGNTLEETVALGCRGSCGTVHIAPVDSFLSNNVMGLRAVDGKTTVGFLAVMLEVADLRNQGVISGAVQEQITRRSLSLLTVMLPPMPEQRRIVDLVGSIDNYIDALQGQIDATRTARQGVLSELLSNPGDDWEATTLGDVAVFEYGKALREADRDGRGFPVLGSAGEIGRHSVPLVPNGPVIIVGRKGTGSAGSVHWSEEPCFVIDTAYWVRIIAEHLSPEFAYLAISSLNLTLLSVNTGVPGLNRDRAYSQFLRLPPLSEQQRIVGLIGSFDEQIAALETQIDAARGTRSGVLSELLSGDRLLDESYDKAVGW